MKISRTLVPVLVLGATLALPGLAATASAPRATGTTVEAITSRCPTTIRMGGHRFAFYKARRVDCRASRTAVRRLYDSRGKRGTPPGYKCRSESKFRRNAGCRTRSGRRFFGYSR